MALKGLDIFKLTPKTNCKDCGSPTCMAFAMKVAQGAISISECPHMSAEALAKLSAATEPPMKTIEIGVGECAYKLGGETVMLRHEKTLVNQNLYGVFLSADMPDAAIDALLGETSKIDYERISTRMYVECVLLKCSANTARNIEVAKKVLGIGRSLILECGCRGCQGGRRGNKRNQTRAVRSERGELGSDERSSQKRCSRPWRFGRRSE